MLREFRAHSRTVAVAVVAASVAFALAACGIKGPLKLPPAPGAAGAPAAPAAPTPPATPAGEGSVAPAVPDKARAP